MHPFPVLQTAGRIVPVVALLIPTLLLFVSTARAAVASFEARVVDKATGRPVANAEISILGHPGERFTNVDGRFTWQPAPPPPFEVLVILPGGRFARPVLVESIPENGVVTLEVEALVNEAVTVTAGAAPSIEATPASGTTLVTSTELQTRTPANLVQALENVPGVSSVSEGQAAVPAIRGFASGRTLILIDGARVSSERRVGPSATYLDPFALDSVEVARGPGSVAYGSDAFGGVISARTRRVAPGSPFGVRFTGTLGAGIPEGRAGVEVSKGFARGSALVQAHLREFRDYRSPEGDVFNSGARDQGFLVRGEHEVGPGMLSAGWQSDFGRDIERPRNNSTVVRFYYPEEDSHRFTTSYELRQVKGFERLAFTGFLGSYAVITDQDRYATATSARRIERADVSANDFQFRGLGERTVGRSHVEFGVDINGRYDLEALDQFVAYDMAGALVSTDTNVSVENAHRTDTGVFGSIQFPATSRLLLSAGLRGDYIGTENTGGYFGDRNTSNGAMSGFGSVTYGFGRFSLSGQLARGFRDPVLSDRYFRGPSGRGFITGNPDLEPETSLQLDGALRYTAPRWRAAVYGFSYRISDLIERYQTEPDFFFFRNRGRARVNGVEVEAQADFGSGLTLDLAAQVTRGRALDDEAYLDSIPPASMSAQLRRQFSPQAFAQVRGAVHARDERPGPTEIVTPGYFLLDLAGGWQFTSQLELRAMARNVLDRSYLLSPDTRTVPAPGASLAVTLLARF